MKGDKLLIKDFHRNAAKIVHDKIENLVENGKIAVCIAGESGSGKTEIAHCLAEEFSNKKCIILCQDDYFRLPPKTNHQNRLKDIKNVGTQEVLLDKLDEHIKILKNMNGKELVKPLVDYDNDKIGQEVVQTDDFDLIIVEGTYTSLLQNLDIRCFIDKSYKETKLNRQQRGRDKLSDFVEDVLEIEHQEISQHKKLADIIL